MTAVGKWACFEEAVKSPSAQGGQRLAAPATLSRSDGSGTELAEVSEIYPYRAPLRLDPRKLVCAARKA